MARDAKLDRYLLDGARMDLAAPAAGATEFLKEHGPNLKAWAAFIGGKLDGWWQGFVAAGVFVPDPEWKR